jgi:hypothetical protein
MPQLIAHSITLPLAAYREAGNSPEESYCLAQIPDFNTLAATSQTHKTPVFALSDAMFGHVGTVLAQDRLKRNQFHALFSELADRVVLLAPND